MKDISKNTKFRIWHYLMIKALVQFALSAENLIITNSIAAYKNLITKLKVKYDLLTDLYALKAVPLTSYAKQKHKLRLSISSSASVVMNAVYIYALDKNLPELASTMNMSRNKLAQLSYTDLIACVQNAMATITPLLPSLTDYDVTAAGIASITNMVTDLQNISTINVRAARKALNIQIQQTLNDAMQIVYDTDRQAMSFSSKEQTYYDTYLGIRKLKPYTKHTKYRVLITDDLNQGIFGVSILQNGTANSITTDINGNATLYIEVAETKDQQPVYQFTITNGSKVVQTGNIEIKMGHTVTQTFNMEPNGFIIPQQASKPVESENEMVIK